MTYAEVWEPSEERKAEIKLEQAKPRSNDKIACSEYVEDIKEDFLNYMPLAKIAEKYTDKIKGGIVEMTVRRFATKLKLFKKREKDHRKVLNMFIQSGMELMSVDKLDGLDAKAVLQAIKIKANMDGELQGNVTNVAVINAPAQKDFIERFDRMAELKTNLKDETDG